MLEWSKQSQYLCAVRCHLQSLWMVSAHSSCVWLSDFPPWSCELRGAGSPGSVHVQEGRGEGGDPGHLRRAYLHGHVAEEVGDWFSVAFFVFFGDLSLMMACCCIICWLVQVEFGEPVDWLLADLGRVDGWRAQDGRVCEGARHQRVTKSAGLTWVVCTVTIRALRCLRPVAPDAHQICDASTFDLLQRLFSESSSPNLRTANQFGTESRSLFQLDVMILGSQSFPLSEKKISFRCLVHAPKLATRLDVC